MIVMNNTAHAAAATDPSPSSATTAATSAIDPLANEQTFLKLLVSQIQNQDPMNPTDSTQFVSQIAQFSQLEQLIGINKGITTLNTDLAPTTPATLPATGN